MKKYNTILQMTLVSLLSACASVTSLTGAKTLKEGDREFAIAAGYSNLKLKISDSDLGGDEPSTTVPNLDAALRYGLTDKDELGIRLVNFGAMTIGDYKRSLYTSEQFAVSVGAGLGYTKFTSSFGADSSSTTIVDLIVPAYADYYASKDLTLYTAPRFIFRKIAGDSSDTQTMMGVNLGLKFGQEAGVLFEGGYAFQLGQDESLENGWQVMAGFFF
jgi:hypothetical protein